MTQQVTAAPPAQGAGTFEPTSAGPLGTARAFGVMAGGPLVLVTAASVSLAATLRALVRRRRPHPAAVAGSAATAVYVGLLRPWMSAWGARDDERRKPLPGDEVVPDPGLQQTHAITVDVPPQDVWGWVAQLGQDRAGFYSHRRLENLAGCRMPDAREVRPEWQERAVGETVPLHPSAGLTVRRFDPGRAIALEGWYLVLEPLDGGRTRLYARTRVPRGLPTLSYAAFVELPHFIMEPRMLRTIKARAEEARAAGR
jgi:hypothetical protein